MNLCVTLTSRAASLLNLRNPELWSACKPRMCSPDEFGPTYRVRFKLPEDIGIAYRFLQACALRNDFYYQNKSMVHRSLNTVVRKMSSALGLTNPLTGEIYLEATNTQAWSFFSAIHNDPADIASWMAYADWCGEQDDPRFRAVNETILGWLMPRPKRKAVRQ